MGAGRKMRPTRSCTRQISDFILAMLRFESLSAAIDFSGFLWGPPSTSRTGELLTFAADKGPTRQLLLIECSRLRGVNNAERRRSLVNRKSCVRKPSSYTREKCSLVRNFGFVGTKSFG